MLLVLAAIPSAASAQDQWWIQNKEVGWCLDSNFAGDVYINPCQGSNKHQRWKIWEGGWTVNVATGYCLQADGRFNPESIYTTPFCEDNPRQFWRAWFGGWKLRMAFSNIPDECLSRHYGSVHDVTGIPCVDPNGWHHPRELWYYNRIS